MEKIKLSPPWEKFYREMVALFSQDSEVHMVYDAETYTIKMFVDNSVKADALTKLLPTEKVFGNVTLKIEVVPADDDSILNTFRTAFNGNPVMTDTYETPDGSPFGGMKYVLFQPEVVQFFNDDLTDAHGLCTTLYANIAEDVFGSKDVHYCTDIK